MVNRKPSEPYTQHTKEPKLDKPKRRGPYGKGILQTKDTQQATPSSSDPITGTEQYKAFCTRYGIMVNRNRRGPYKKYKKKPKLEKPKQPKRRGPYKKWLLQTKDTQQTTRTSSDPISGPETFEKENVHKSQRTTSHLSAPITCTPAAEVQDVPCPQQIDSSEPVPVLVPLVVPVLLPPFTLNYKCNI